MSFAYPINLFFLLILPFLYYIYKNRLKKFYVKFPLQGRSIASKKTTFSFFNFINHLSFVFLLIAIILVIIAMARPQKGFDKSMVKSDGLDIFLVIDTSESMAQKDMVINNLSVDRLQAVKNVISQFIAKRINDRIGLVIFGSEAYAQSPLTNDHRVLSQFLDDIDIGMAGNKTAIGDAIGVASNRLSFDSKSKIMILLTDGANTAGSIDPKLAARAAGGLGIKIYTIGIAGQGMSFFGMQVMRSAVDQELLVTIADTTGGKYFDAKTTQDLRDVYQAIDKLEKTEVSKEVYTRYKELYSYFAWWGLIAFFLSQILAMMGLGRLP